MIIIQTVNDKCKDTKAQFCTKIQKLLDSKCCHIRINFKNFTPSDLEQLKFIFFCIKRVDPNKLFSISIDIPIAKSKCILNTNSTRNIKKGETLRILPKSSADFYRHPNTINYIESSFFNILKNKNLGHEFIWGDGEAYLELVDSCDDYIILKSNTDFILYDNKALSNIHNNTSLSKEQIKYMKYLTSNFNISNIFLSFCENPEEILKIKKNFPQINICAKIETKQGVENLDSILKVADGVMIARGDLAFNISLEKFLETQNTIANKAKKYNKKLFVATDILTSLNYKAFPSRADLCDFELISSYSPEAIILKGTSFHKERFLKISEFIASLNFDC